jgi:hypothetical protein
MAVDKRIKDKNMEVQRTNRRAAGIRMAGARQDMLFPIVLVVPNSGPPLNTIATTLELVFNVEVDAVKFASSDGDDIVMVLPKTFEHPRVERNAADIYERFQGLFPTATLNMTLEEVVGSRRPSGVPPIP